MKRILIIEDEESLRNAMVRGLSKMDDVVILQAGTVDEAILHIDATPPDVVLSDIDLPGRIGLEIIGELGKRKLNTPVIFISAYLTAYQSQIPKHANTEILEKPVPLEQLRQVVRKYLSPGIHEKASPFDVPDYLQLACIGRHSVVIRVARFAEEMGHIVVVKGELWTAKDDLGLGVPAFNRLAFMTDAAVSCSRLNNDPDERMIYSHWESVLMNAAKEFDEREAGASKERGVPTRASDLFPEVAYVQESVPPSPAQAELVRKMSIPPSLPPLQSNVPPPPSAEERTFREAWNNGVEALLDKDYAAAMTAFILARDIRPDHPGVRANLSRLKDLGFSDIEDPKNHSDNQ